MGHLHHSALALGRDELLAVELLLKDGPRSRLHLGTVPGEAIDILDVQIDKGVVVALQKQVAALKAAHPLGATQHFLLDADAGGQSEAVHGTHLMQLLLVVGAFALGLHQLDRVDQLLLGLGVRELHCLGFSRTKSTSSQ
eukprot:353265_1